MKLTKKGIASFQRFIFDWWEINRRDFPWRHTHDPYKILVSEIMLQQTQVSRVVPKYREFLKKFPDARTLSRSTNAEVLREWKGMGYNRRALYLKKIAKIGKFPNSEKALLKLPGVGIYTARALLVFAYKQEVAAIDTNIRRIITYHFFDNKPQKEKVIQDIADQLLPKGKSWEWHQALMDYGSLKLKKTKIKKHIQIPFKQSNRFFRGRIIDLLREKQWKERIFLNYLIQKYHKPKDFFQDRLHDLIRENLIHRQKHDMVSL